jgi:alpha-galactosidase
MPITLRDDYWLLETDLTAYAFGLNRARRLTHAYWGPRLPYADDYPLPPSPSEWSSFNPPAQLTPEEYPGDGEAKFVEVCLKVAFQDGVRDLWLRFVSASQTDKHTLVITLQDERYPLVVSLYYRVHAAYDLIERWATIHNQDDQVIRLERAWSAQWHLPGGYDYRLSHLTGRWFDEGLLRRDRLPHGTTRLESRRITSSHHAVPWFALDHNADEEHGAVWFGALAWSGNWVLAAEVTDFAQTRVSIGLNDWDFAWQLQAGEAFSTPTCLAGYSNVGFGGASRAMQRYLREQVIRPPATLKVLYNSWEATQFHIDHQRQTELAQLAAELGVEVFVLDDGWFHRRYNDQAGLGDWWPDSQNFPEGLQPLISEVQRLGMEFGLWIEPEMVSPDSDLYRAHPDWVIHFAGRPRTTARNQLILNMARTDVQDYLIAIFDKLLIDHAISYVKWDMNRNVSEPGWPAALGEPRELWVRYVQGVYRVWGTLRERHPQITWLSCSGGGGRADIGILRYADRVQISDNTEANAILRMLNGFSQFLPASALESWVTDVGATYLPLAYRFHASMGNILCLGIDLPRWNATQRGEAAALIAEYKALRPLIQHGDRFRLASFGDGCPYAAHCYLSPDRRAGVVFIFRGYAPDPQLPLRLHLPGLIPTAHYQIAEFGTYSGAAWATVGLQLDLHNFQSVVLRIQLVAVSE